MRSVQKCQLEGLCWKTFRQGFNFQEAILFVVLQSCKVKPRSIVAVQRRVCPSCSGHRHAGIGIEAPPCRVKKRHLTLNIKRSRVPNSHISNILLLLLSHTILLKLNFQPDQKHGCKSPPARLAKPACPSCLSLPHAPVTYASKADDMFCHLARV